MDERFHEDPYAYQKLLGIEMRDWRADYALFALPIEEHIMNRHGNPHGGAHASLLDTVMGYAGCWTGDPDKRQMCLTLSLNIQYISRPLGKVFLAEGFKTGGGRSTFFAEGVVKDETGELVAKGSGVFRYRKLA